MDMKEETEHEHTCDFLNFVKHLLSGCNRCTLQKKNPAWVPNWDGIVYEIWTELHRRQILTSWKEGWTQRTLSDLTANEDTAALQSESKQPWSMEWFADWVRRRFVSTGSNAHVKVYYKLTTCIFKPVLIIKCRIDGESTRNSWMCNTFGTLRFCGSRSYSDFLSKLYLGMPTSWVLTFH